MLALVLRGIGDMLRGPNSVCEEFDFVAERKETG